MYNYEQEAISKAQSFIEGNGRLIGYAGETWLCVYDEVTGFSIIINYNPVSYNWPLTSISGGQTNLRVFHKVNSLEGMMEEFGFEEEECEVGALIDHQTCLRLLQKALKNANALVAEGRAIITKP